MNTIKDFFMDNFSIIFTTLFGGGGFIAGLFLERRKRRIEEKQLHAEALKTIQEAYNVFSLDLLKMYNDLKDSYNILKNEFDQLKEELENVKEGSASEREKLHQELEDYKNRKNKNNLPKKE